MGKAARRKRKKRLVFEVQESIKKFFPPTSPMGFATPIPYGQPKPGDVQKTDRDRLYSNDAVSPGLAG